jgi:adenylate kinase family enzyme
VVDGNYTSRLDGVLDGVDTVVWLDYPRRLVLSRVLRRTLLRVLLRRRLWNGNRERWHNLLTTDPAKNIILWSWTRHPLYRRRYAADAAEATRVQWVRLCTPAEADTWLRAQEPG